MPGRVTKLLGPVSMLVELEDGRVWKRHMDHVKISNSGESYSDIQASAGSDAAAESDGELKRESEDSAMVPSNPATGTTPHAVPTPPATDTTPHSDHILLLMTLLLVLILLLLMTLLPISILLLHRLSFEGVLDKGRRQTDMRININ